MSTWHGFLLVLIHHVDLELASLCPAFDIVNTRCVSYTVIDSLRRNVGCLRSVRRN